MIPDYTSPSWTIKGAAERPRRAAVLASEIPAPRAAQPAWILNRSRLDGKGSGPLFVPAPNTQAGGAMPAPTRRIIMVVKIERREARNA